MDIVQLIYVSTATRDLDDHEIRRVLDSSLAHNQSHEVTGMLLYSWGSFMQVLEGTESAVQETMYRIYNDPRHHGIIVMSKGKVRTREFGHWSMGFRGIQAKDAASWPGYAPFFEHGFNAALIGAQPGVALEMLKAFGRNN
jgi:hypothetical protein